MDQLVHSAANAKRIALVEHCFGGAGQPLSLPGRVLVGQGVLNKSCRKRLKPRRFFLFNDLLVYGNIIIDQKKYNKQHIIPLEEIKLKTLNGEDTGGSFGWLICARGKSFAVYAATALERKEWMHHLDKCIRELVTTSGKKPASDHAAVWVPDSEASVCMTCKKHKFNAVNRRHHCRKCGSVVCGSCSTKRFLLPTQSSKPLRVCDLCFHSLSTAPSFNVSSSETNVTDAAASKLANASLEDNTVDSSGEEDSDDESGAPNASNHENNGSETPTSSTWELAFDDVDGQKEGAENVTEIRSTKYIVAEEGKVSHLSQVGPLPRIGGNQS